MTVVVAVTNVGVTRAIPFRPFDERGQPDDPAVALRDAEGKTLAMQGSGPGWSVAGKPKAAPLIFGNSINDVLVFELPKGPWDTLSLDLPGAAVGSTGLIRFRLPASMVGSGKNPTKTFIE